MQHRFFATAAPGVASVLAEELRDLDCAELREQPGGVTFTGSLAQGYRVTLWTRTASRVLLTLVQTPAATAEELYQHALDFPWEEHLAPDASFAIEASAAKPAIANTQFALLKLKDALVDRFRTRTGQRPSISLTRPSVVLHLHLQQAQATVSLDLAGESLHQRGYRGPTGAAPLKETLAAALLLRAQWPKIAQGGGTLVDPMCGSGTLLIEAAWIAGDRAPALLRDYFGFLGWRQHEAQVWQQLREDAVQRARMGRERIPPLFGHDHDPAAIVAATANVNRAGLADKIQLACADMDVRLAPLTLPLGLVLTNPPYGERIGAEVEALHRRLGDSLKHYYPGWHAAVFTHVELVDTIGLHAERTHAFANGMLDCRLARYQLWMPRATLPTPASAKEDVSAVQGETSLPAPRPEAPAPAMRADAVMFANRLRKNLKRLGKWARTAEVTCYRLYDADMPEFALALDLYQDEAGELWANAQEYAAPAEIDPEQAQARWLAALAVIAEVLALPPARVVAKQRKRQKDAGQYGKQPTQAGQAFVVREQQLRFTVNLWDYLDTGLFLDHRWVRQWLRSHAAGKRFLNLFAYTASATVYAAAGGAVGSVSVDMSRPYLDWAAANFQLNKLDPWRHVLVQADCLEWLRMQAKRADVPWYDLIFIDPPTFSRSKRMQDSFNVQTDHVALIQGAAQLLAPKGQIVFSTNYQKFKLTSAELSGFTILDLSAESIPPDFARHPRIHYCYLLTRSICP